MTERTPKARFNFPALAPHLSDRLKREPRIEHRATIDRGLQTSLETLLRKRIKTLGPSLSAALIVADHRTGDVLASIGSPILTDTRRQGFVDMTRAIRSPGSTLKPLIYGLGFEAGAAHPEMLIEDRPTNFGGYSPSNFDKTYRGTVSVREALQLVRRRGCRVIVRRASRLAWEVSEFTCTILSLFMPPSLVVVTPLFFANVWVRCDH